MSRFKPSRLGLYAIILVMQALLMLVINDCLHACYPLERRDISWGITTYYFFLGHCVLAALVNIIVVIAQVNWKSIISCLLLLALFIWFFSPGIESRPVRLPTLMITCSLLISISFFGEALLNRFFGKTKSVEDNVLDQS